MSEQEKEVEKIRRRGRGGSIRGRESCSEDEIIMHSLFQECPCFTQYFKAKDALPAGMDEQKPATVLDALSAKEGAESTEEDMDTGEDGCGDHFETGSDDDVSVCGAEGVKAVSEDVRCDGVEDLRSERIGDKRTRDCGRKGVKENVDQVKDNMERVNDSNEGVKEGSEAVTSECCGVFAVGGGSGGVESAQVPCEEEGKGRKRKRDEGEDGTEAGDEVPLLPAAKHSKQAGMCVVCVAQPVWRAERQYRSP